MTLYHFTCDHGRDGIVRDGVVKPNRHPYLGLAVAWFTDLADPTADEVGLTSATLRCDRLAYRFEIVDLAKAHPWLGSVEQSVTPIQYQADLHRFSTPRHWWVSRQPVSVSLASLVSL
jgi:hypothetical protein